MQSQVKITKNSESPSLEIHDFAYEKYNINIIQYLTKEGH